MVFSLSDIISIIGTAVGIGGMFFSIITYKKAGNIEKAVKCERAKRQFGKNHSNLQKDVKNLLNTFNADGEMTQYMAQNFHQIMCNIDTFYAVFDKNDKKLIIEMRNFSEETMKLEKYDSTTRTDVISYLHKLIAILKKEEYFK